MTAQLIFFTGPMDCGKSTLALQVNHTQAIGGRLGRLFTCQDRSGQPMITSRIGLAQPAVLVDADFDFWDYTVRELSLGHRIDYYVCDEAQFYQPAQIDQLARIADEAQIEVLVFGILSDFRTELFPGSKRLIELADRIERLPVQPLCWCGRPGTHNARIVDGQMVTTGEQVVVGDTIEDLAQPSTGEDRVGRPQPAVRYEVLCRRHHRERLTAQAVQAAPADPLPLGPTD